MERKRIKYFLKTHIRGSTEENLDKMVQIVEQTINMIEKSNLSFKESKAVVYGIQNQVSLMKS